jgi:hypothetical protein
MAAASLSTLRAMATECNFADEVIRAGYRMTIVSPITPYDDPLLDFQEAMNLVDPDLFATFNAATATKPPELAVRPTQKSRADYVAIVNMIFSAERSDFEEWDAPGGFTKRLLQFVGGLEIEIPMLRPRIAAMLQLHRLAFKATQKVKGTFVIAYAVCRASVGHRKFCRLRALSGLRTSI